MRVVLQVLFIVFCANAAAADQRRPMGEVISQYAGIPPDDERLEPYWSLAEELDIPVEIHVGPGQPGTVYLGAKGLPTVPRT